MQIKELALATGVDVETIRYYEKQGLMPAPARRENGYRDYAVAHLERLSCGDVDLLVDDQLARVRARLKSMRALEKQLLRLRARCLGTHEGAHCGILEELVSAAHGESCACHPA